jgi:hypothetical protein
MHVQAKTAHVAKKEVTGSRRLIVSYDFLAPLFVHSLLSELRINPLLRLSIDTFNNLVRLF